MTMKKIEREAKDLREEVEELRERLRFQSSLHQKKVEDARNKRVSDHVVAVLLDLSQKTQKEAEENQRFWVMHNYAEENLPTSVWVTRAAADQFMQLAESVAGHSLRQSISIE